jgi:hypothetical protein
MILLWRISQRRRVGVQAESDSNGLAIGQRPDRAQRPQSLQVKIMGRKESQLKRLRLSSSRCAPCRRAGGSSGSGDKGRRCASAPAGSDAHAAVERAKVKHWFSQVGIMGRLLLEPLVLRLSRRRIRAVSGGCEPVSERGCHGAAMAAHRAWARTIGVRGVHASDPP